MTLLEAGQPEVREVTEESDGYRISFLVRSRSDEGFSVASPYTERVTQDQAACILGKKAGTAGARRALEARLMEAMKEVLRTIGETKTWSWPEVIETAIARTATLEKGDDE